MKTDPRDVPSRDILGPVLTWRQTNLLPELQYCFLSYLVLYLCVYPPKTVWVEYLVNLACHRVVDGQEEKQIISMEQQNPCTFPPHFRSSSPCQRYIMNRGLISHDIPSLFISMPVLRAICQTADPPTTVTCPICRWSGSVKGVKMT